VHNAIATAALDPTAAGRALEIARHGTEQLTRLVDDLLDMTRITRGLITLRKSRTGLSAIVQRAIDSVHPIFKEYAIALTVSLPAQDLEAEVDSARIEQVIGNLLTNAAKYTEPEGSVTVSLGHVDGQAVLRVHDTGIGIAPELLPRVFDLFVQAKQAADRPRGGLGIGLTLVKQLVEMHGGRVEAKSDGLGCGAEFTVRLPATVRTQEVSSTNVLQRPRPGADRRVLIVEDNVDAAESMVMLLELLGLRVRAVGDGVAALEAARANPPDVMLIDIGLPGMDGYELAQHLRREEKLRDITLVALTGYGQEEDRQRALAAGFDYHLVKPVDFDKVERLVAGLAPSRQSIH
jgi:CheY-like chemotaxis protein